MPNTWYRYHESPWGYL